MKKPESALDQFRIQEAKINEDVAESEKYYDRVIREQEKIRDAAKAEREKAAGVLAGLIADFEKIEAELEAEAVTRLDAEGKTKAALNEGRVSASEYFKRGLTAGEVTAKAQASASEKLGNLRDLIRTKAVKVLELEAAELEAEYNIWFARIAPAAAMKERLAGLIKALESSLSSPLGIGGDPGVKAMRDAKLNELNNAQGRRLTGDGWKDFDLQGLKRLRLDPTWPESELPKLEEIISEAKTTGRRVRVMLDPMHKPHVLTMWS